MVGSILILVACGGKSGSGPRCGNGVAETAEECDGVDLQGADCAELGLEGGSLSCSQSCTYNVTECTGEAQCGNGLVEYPEQCDATNLADTTCEDLGFDGGTLRCSALCSFDTSLCEVASVCGDDVVQGDEECDGEDLQGADCAELGLEGGTLTCGADCRYNVSACTGTAACGNDTWEYPEACDGAQFGGKTCQTEGFTGGTLACNSDCTLNTGGCTGCGNGRVEADEACDGTDFDGKTCQTEGFGGGDLTCNNDCTLDTGACTAQTTPVCMPSPTPAQVNESGGPVTITFTCTDADGDLLTVADASAMTGVAYAYTDPANPLSVQITLNPDADDAGPTGHLAFNATFTVADPDANAVTVVQPVSYDNLAPTYSPNPVPNQVVTVGDTLDVVIPFDDPDGDALTFTPTLPAYGSLATSGNTATVTFAPTGAGDDSGSPDNASVRADDPQNGSVTAAFTVEVNQVPLANAGADISATPNSTVGLDGTGSWDPDGDPLTYHWTGSTGAPALDDPHSATPTLLGGACGESYTYTLVVNDGLVSSAPDTVVVSLNASGPYVSVDDCTPGDECGDLTRPWCTITGGVEAARTYGYPQVFVKEGEYDQGATATVNETLEIQAVASGSDPEIRGGYTNLTTLARAAGPSCDTSSAGSGATVVVTTTAVGIHFMAGTTNLFDGFCVLSHPTTNLAVKANLTVDDASPILANNIVDAVATSAPDTSLGILVRGADPTAPAAPEIHHNRDATADGRYFGGNGVNAAVGVQINGAAHVRLHDNVLTGGNGADVTLGVGVEGQGALLSEDNDITAGYGGLTGVGIKASQDGGDLDVTLHRNIVRAGTPSDEAVAGRFEDVQHLVIEDQNLFTCATTTTTESAYGLYLTGVTLAEVKTDNRIFGGFGTLHSAGILADAGTTLRVETNNTIRGGTPGAGAAELTGIQVQNSPELRVSTGNRISGAALDGTTGLPVEGGFQVTGIHTINVPSVEITGNPEILGGGAQGPTVSPGSRFYRGAGVHIEDGTAFTVARNDWIRGCQPSCGPGGQPAASNPVPVTAVGVLIEGTAGSGTKTIDDNGTIEGGPVEQNPTRSVSVGVDVVGSVSSGSVTPLVVSVTSNTTLSGNVDPDPMGDLWRPQGAIGVRVQHAEVTLSDNTLIQGGRASLASVGLDVVQLASTTTAVLADQNGQILGNPFDDGANNPYAVFGVRADGAGGISLAVTGIATDLQEIGGGYARPNSQGAAVGVRVLDAADLELSHNHVWAGLVPGGLIQRGVWLEDPNTKALVEANLIEACGVLGTGSATHAPGCELLYARSEGLRVRDGLGTPTWIWNNRIFGGYSNSGTTGARVQDSGNSAAQVKFTNNYVNAQGAMATDCNSPTTVADARAIELVTPDSSLGFGQGVEFHNNIFDGGGRTCRRYGVYEVYPGGIADVFTYAQFTHNLWVQALPGRDITVTGTETWGYRESNGTLWCEAGTDTIAPGDCLNNPDAPTTATDYTANIEGDPGFAGSDVDLSERPGSLPLADFHATAAALQGAGDCSSATYVTDDFEGDSRTATCDIGHDETP